MDIVIISLAIFFLVIKTIMIFKADREYWLSTTIINCSFLICFGLSNLYYFEFYQDPNFSTSDFEYFKVHAKRENIARILMISAFVLHFIMTILTFLLTSTITYVMFVSKFILTWIWPLILMYIIVILILTFVLESLTFTFSQPISENIISVFRMICNSNTYYLSALLNESPTWFLIIMICIEIIVFFIFNNIYFGLGFEIVRLLDASKKDCWKFRLTYNDIKNGRSAEGTGEAQKLGF